MYYGDYTHLARLPEQPSSHASTDRARSQRTIWSAEEPGIEQILAHENLINTYRRLAVENGQSPGVDGLTYEDLSPKEVCWALRNWTREFMRTRTYWPQRTRLKLLPKLNGGHRRIRIATILDRVIAAAVAEALSPFWEARFLNGSFGFRPRRSVWKMLAHMEAFVIREGHRVLVVEDIRKAFDSINLQHLMADHRRHLVGSDLVRLIDSVTHGWSGKGRRFIGIDQGSPYSPTGLNVRLHHAHDLPMCKAMFDGAWLRYADNHIYVCSTGADAQLVKRLATKCLGQAGLQFKGRGRCCVDLHAGTSTPVLGFRVTINDGQMYYLLDESAFCDLRDKLKSAHRTVNPPKRARAIVSGWIEAFGPVWQYEATHQRAFARLRNVLKELCLRDAVTPDEMEEMLYAAGQRWNHLRSSVWQDWERQQMAHGRRIERTVID